MFEFTKVTIDFETSHLLFPTIIACILALLGACVLIRDRKRLATTGKHWSDIFEKMDKKRFFVTLFLTVVYFSLMVPIGDIWPNTGYGFLICSIPFLFLAGMLFLHEYTKRTILPIVIVALIAPTFVWWLFTDLFFLSLP